MTPTEALAIPVRGWLARYSLAGFFVLAFAISWTLWLGAFLAGEGAIRLVLFLLGGFGPLVSAALVTHATGDSVKAWLHSIFRFHVRTRFYAYALGVPILVYAAVNTALTVMGQGVDTSLLLGRIGGYLGTLVFVTILGGGLEEPGWRGFALPRLQATHSPTRATLILGFLWGLWHVPLYGPLGFAVPLVLAFLYSYPFNATGSVIPCILLHGSFTAAQDNLTLIADESHGLTDAAIGLAYLAGAILVVALTRGRLGLEIGPKRVLPRAHQVDHL